VARKPGGFQPKGITEKEYVDECRDFTAAPTAPAAPKSASRQGTHAVAPGPAPAGKPARTTTATPGEGNQFPTEEQARPAVVLTLSYGQT
jgi:hypothetical protein